MEHQLLLLRHGKSDWSEPVSDFDRPLKGRGKRGAKKIGRWLEQNQCVPDQVISSPANRAFNTALKACQAMGKEEPIKIDSRIYEDDLHEILSVIQECPNTVKRLMLVGHNPDMEELVLELPNREIMIPDDGKLMPTATLALFRVPCSWGALDFGIAELISITRPDDIP